MARRSPLHEALALIRLAIPFAIGQVGLMFMGVVDTMMVGRVSEEALAAVALGHIYSFGICIPFSGLIFALDPLLAQAFGAQDHRSLAATLHRGAILVGAILVPVVGLLWVAEPVLRSLGQKEEVLPLVTGYCRACAPGMAGYFAFLLLRHTVQAMSIIRPVVLAVLVANGANVLLNYLLVFGHWGFPALGPVGSGWATTGSRFVMAALLFLMSWPVLRPYWRTPVTDRWRWSAYHKIFALGIPVGVQVSLEVWCFFAVSLIMGTLGTLELDGHQIAMSLASLSFMVPLSIGMASATRVGNAVGRRDIEGARLSAWMSIVLGALVMTVSAAAFILIPKELARLYTDLDSVIEMAALVLPIAGVFQIMDGTQAVACGVLRGIADTRVPAVINFFSYWALAIPVGWLLAFRGELGPRGLWWGLTTGLAVAAVLLTFRIRQKFRTGIVAAFDSSAAKAS